MTFRPLSTTYPPGIRPWRLSRAILLFSFTSTVLSSAGCRAWANERGVETLVPATMPREAIRITRTDKSKVILRDVVVSNDTLFGTVRGSDNTRVSLPVADIATVERRKVTVRSAAATIGIVAGAIFVADIIATCGGWGCGQ